MTDNASETSPLDPTLGRKIPVLFLVGSLAGIVWHHWHVITTQDVRPKLLLLLTAVAGFALAGVVQPRVFWSIGKYGRHLPTSMRVVALLAAAIGFAVGMWALLMLYSG